MYTLVSVPRAVANFERFPWAAVIVVASVLSIANIPRSMYKEKAMQAFISSSIAIASLVSLFGLALWPNLVTASNNPAHSLTVYNAASSAGTLWTMFVIALVGMPFVLTYTAVVYWTFRGRVELGEHSY
jgi:cytochrome d ubiquinol oxidase subunit II